MRGADGRGRARAGAGSVKGLGSASIWHGRPICTVAKGVDKQVGRGVAGRPGPETGFQTPGACSPRGGGSTR